MKDRISMISLVLSSMLLVSSAPVATPIITPPSIYVNPQVSDVSHMEASTKCIAIPVGSQPYKDDQIKLTLFVRCNKAYRIVLLHQMSGLVYKDIEAADTGFGPHLTPLFINKADDGRFILHMATD
jgi:hypothetical protein